MQRQTHSESLSLANTNKFKSPWCLYYETEAVIFIAYQLGSSVVNWLISWSFAENRSEGVRIGQDLIKRGYIQSVDTIAVTLFRDVNRAFYRFVS